MTIELTEVEKQHQQDRAMHDVLVSQLLDLGCNSGVEILNQQNSTFSVLRQVMDTYGPEFSLGHIAHYLTGERTYLPMNEWFEGLPPREGAVTEEQLQQMGAVATAQILEPVAGQ